MAHSLPQTPNGPLFDARMEALVERFRRHLVTLPSPSADLGEALIGKLVPPRWTLEWYLPRWLGETLGLAPDVIDDLVLANVFGLCYIVLQDKLTDDELDRDYRHHARFLGTALHHWWLTQNALICAGDSTFWHQFTRIMEEWWTATAASNVQPEGTFAQVLDNSWSLLAHRASPLKICCVATTLLAGCADLLVPLEKSIDRLHVAAVMLDHAYDWRDDLSAGRYNLFVHSISPLRQIPAHGRELDEQVMEELWFGEGAKPYFAQAHEQLDLALAAAARVDCGPLSNYIIGYGDRLDNYSNALVRFARSLLLEATAEIFGEPV